MRLLNKEDILKNRVDTISQYHILDYLKKNLNVDEFKIYLVDPDNIKEVTYQDELKVKEHDYEIGL